MSNEWLNQLEEHLWPKGFRRDAWMIIDSARDSRIYGLLLECFYSQHACLFSGSIAPELQVVAPYLVQLDHDHRTTRRFLREAWCKSWGVFLKCDSPVDVLRRHLRTFLTVKDESGNRLMFRYYDPRILRVYLPTCTVDELRTVFGPIDRFFMEEEMSNTLVEFGFDKRKLISSRFSLNQLNEKPVG